MNRTTFKTLALAAGVLAVTALVAGCQEEQNQTDTLSNQATSRPEEVERMSKLIAAQNVELKEQLRVQEQLHAKQLQKERMLHEEKMEKQKKLLDRCMQQNKGLEELSKEGVESYMSSIVGPLADKNDKLSRENKALKVQVRNLEGQIERLEAEIGMLKERANAGES